LPTFQYYSAFDEWFRDFATEETIRDRIIGQVGTNRDIEIGCRTHAWVERDFSTTGRAH